MVLIWEKTRKTSNRWLFLLRHNNPAVVPCVQCFGDPSCGNPAAVYLVYRSYAIAFLARPLARDQAPPSRCRLGNGIEPSIEPYTAQKEYDDVP
jgi:hypothetical protein